MPKKKPKDSLQSCVVVLLLLLAGVHCAMSIVYDNEEWLSLSRYAAGQERNPYQGRAALVPVLRWAGSNYHMVKWAQRAETRFPHLRYSVPIGPEKLASMAIGIGSIWGAILICNLYGVRRLPRLWWLPATILLAILYASYGARYEHALWYPYDLPHMLLFGASCACLLSGRPLGALAFFLLDIPVRETSLYLVPLSFCLFSKKRRTKQYIAMACVALLLWAAIRLPIMYAYRHNTTELGNRLLRNVREIKNIADWPTIASSVGFLVLPVWFGRKYLSFEARAFLWLTLPCAALSSYYGILIESRVFVEWTLPFALLAASEVDGYLRVLGAGYMPDAASLVESTKIYRTPTR